MLGKKAIDVSKILKSKRNLLATDEYVDKDLPRRKCHRANPNPISGKFSSSDLGL